MKKYITFILVFVSILGLVGCSPETKSFELEDVQKMIVISISGERTEITDTDTIRQITNNIASIQFTKGESNANTNGFGPIVQWYDSNGDLIEAISVMSKQTIIDDGHFWQTTKGSIDTAILHELLK